MSKKVSLEYAWQVWKQLSDEDKDDFCLRMLEDRESAIALSLHMTMKFWERKWSRHPNDKRDQEIVKLRDDKRLSWGQISKLKKIGVQAARMAYKRFKENSTLEVAKRFMDGD